MYRFTGTQVHTHVRLVRSLTGQSDHEFLACLGIECARVLGLFAGRLDALDLVAEGRMGDRMAASSDDC